MDILGVRVDNLSRDEILRNVLIFLGEKKIHQIATVNPEFILEAQKDEEFRNILNGCDLNIADGFGIKLAFWRFGETLKARATGIDLMQEILKIAEKGNLKIFLAANSRGLSTWEEAAAAIKNKYPGLDVNGENLDKNVADHNLPGANYEIIFCNFGAPHQEKFLNSLKSAENSKIRLAMGAGGSFDYLTGKVQRAPAWMQKTGLEWLWRLIQQPRRIKRIINATIIFPVKIILKKQ
ncbi:MAG: hypothetical protein A2Z52_02785 [Candidatus Moranbacteria bacterium RBG_19FT_COMBO_42_6]|nr:MAG: hypothetical protein A2Z52_02785 [Candidatus Moranbacteria bacterium RBG_19FT_COMBO_42_6]